MLTSSSTMRTFCFMAFFFYREIARIAAQPCGCNQTVKTFTAETRRTLKTEDRGRMTRTSPVSPVCWVSLRLNPTFNYYLLRYTVSAEVFPRNYFLRFFASSAVKMENSGFRSALPRSNPTSGSNFQHRASKLPRQSM